MYSLCHRFNLQGEEEEASLNDVKRTSGLGAALYNFKSSAPLELAAC